MRFMLVPKVILGAGLLAADFALVSAAYAQGQYDTLSLSAEAQERQRQEQTIGKEGADIKSAGDTTSGDTTSGDTTSGDTTSGNTTSSSPSSTSE